MVHRDIPTKEIYYKNGFLLVNLFTYVHLIDQIRKQIFVGKIFLTVSFTSWNFFKIFCMAQT